MTWEKSARLEFGLRKSIILTFRVPVTLSKERFPRRNEILFCKGEWVYPWFAAIFIKGDNFCDLLATLDEGTLSKIGYTCVLKENNLLIVVQVLFCKSCLPLRREADLKQLSCFP